MRRFFSRRRLATILSTCGIALMGVDLTLTRNPFIHVGELMVASLVCLAAGVALDRSATRSAPPEKNAKS